MKKFALILLISLFISNIVFANPFCIKEPICIREVENGFYVIKINTKQYSVRPYAVQKGLDTSENVYKNNKFYGVLNGGYFDSKNMKTVSFVAKDSAIILDALNNEHLSQNPLIKDHVDLIFNRSELRRMDCDGEIKYDILKHYDTVPDGCRLIDSLQAGPLLYPENKSTEEFFTKYDENRKLVRDAIQVNDKKPRTAIALKNNNVYFIIATKNHPMSLNDLHNFASKQNYDKMLNLDGGGSTSFTNSEINIKSERDGSQRKVKSFLVIE